MIQAFLLGLRLYTRWYLQAFRSDNRTLAPLSVRRILFLFILMPLFAFLQAIHWLAFSLDEVFFRGYRRIVIRKPLFITGIPRSGTTFVHRTLARDSEQFTSLKTWECLFAPSVTERLLIRCLSRVDRVLGRPFARLISLISKHSTDKLNKIHEIDQHSVEEDYLLLLPVGGCFIMILAFPWSMELQKLGRFNELPEKHRQTMLDFYKACLQKHLYVNGKEQLLLSKNASFGSWIPELARQFPDARFLACIREPAVALNSQLSSLRDGLHLFGSLPAGNYIQKTIQNNLMHVYLLLREMQKRESQYHLAVLDYDQLKSDSIACIKNSLTQLDVTITEKLQQALEEAEYETSAYVSRHHYNPPVSEGPSSTLMGRLSHLHTEIISAEHSHEHNS